VGVQRTLGNDGFWSAGAGLPTGPKGTSGRLPQHARPAQSEGENAGMQRRLIMPRASAAVVKNALRELSRQLPSRPKIKKIMDTLIDKEATIPDRMSALSPVHPPLAQSSGPLRHLDEFPAPFAFESARKSYILLS
jgi:hypothetical protein